MTASGVEQAKAIEDLICNYAQLRLQQSLTKRYQVDRLQLADGRILQPQRVMLVFDARLQWLQDSLDGYTLTLSSSQFRHRLGGPAATVFFESPSVLLLADAKLETLAGDRLMPALSPIVERHLQRLMR